MVYSIMAPRTLSESLTLIKTKRAETSARGPRARRPWVHALFLYARAPTEFVAKAESLGSSLEMMPHTRVTPSLHCASGSAY